MKLIYLWVEDYKNIHKQGFNFLPRFHCEYDSEKNKLLICDREDENCKGRKECKEFCNESYLKDFFGENINVTAIVGKNGSGKSSLIEFMSNIYMDDNLIKIVVFFDYKNKLYYYISNIKNIKTTININILDKMPSNLIVYNINPSPFFDRQKTNNIRYMHNLSIKYLDLYYSDLKINEICRGSSPFAFDFKDFLNREIYLQVLLFKDKKLKSFVEKYFNIKEPCFLKIIPEGLQYDYYQAGENFTYENMIKDFIYFALDSSNKNDITEFQSKLVSKKEDDYLLLPLNHCEIFFNYSPKFFEKFTLKFLTSEYEDIRFSTGEQIILFYIIRIYSILNNENLLITIDELELYLHPTWQKKILKLFIDLFQLFKSNLQLVLSSHSPFLLSDIPKQNIIFLDKDKEGNCKVVDGLNEKDQTFGANIHTLLSDSFFMEDGLMGEFAKSKINEIIDFHKKVKDKDANIARLKEEYIKKRDKFYQTQSIVGEAYLKQILENHLLEIDKILLGNDKAKEKLRERLEQQLRALDE